MNGRKLRKLMFSIFFLGYSVFLLSRIPGGWSVHKESMEYHFNQEGLWSALCGAVWFAAFVYLVRECCQKDAGSDPDPSHEHISIQVAAIQRLEMLNMMRVATFLVMCTRALLTPALILLNMKFLPERDPRENFNFEMHVVASFEMAGLLPLFILALDAMCSCSSDQETDQETSAADFVEFVKWTKRLGRFTVLRLLPYSNPVLVMQRVSGLQRQNTCLFLLAVFGQILFLVPLSILALLTKVAQISFVAKVGIWNWSHPDWIKFLVVFNSFVGMLQDSVDTEVLGMFKLIGTKLGRADRDKADRDNDVWFCRWNSQEEKDKFSVQLVKRLMQDCSKLSCSKLRVCMVYCSLTPADVQELSPREPLLPDHQAKSNSQVELPCLRGDASAGAEQSQQELVNAQAEIASLKQEIEKLRTTASAHAQQEAASKAAASAAAEEISRLSAALDEQRAAASAAQAEAQKTMSHQMKEVATALLFALFFKAEAETLRGKLASPDLF